MIGGAQSLPSTFVLSFLSITRQAGSAVCLCVSLHVGLFLGENVFLVTSFNVKTLTSQPNKHTRTQFKTPGIDINQFNQVYSGAILQQIVM